MPPSKQSKGPNPTKNLSEKQIRRIWSELKAPVLLERLRGAQPAGKWNGAGSQIVGCCPFHEETGPSFRIYLDRGYAKCFGGSCEKFVWNPIELWSKVRGVSLSDALNDLRQQFGLKFLSASAKTQLEAWERNQLVKKRIMALCHDELINAINHPNDPNYAAAQPAVKYLLQTRQIPVETLPALHMVGIVPPLGRILDALKAEAEQENLRRQAESLGEKVVQFVSLEEEARNYMQQAAGWVGAVAFCLHTTPDTIGRIKLRKPINANPKPIIILPDEFESNLGFMGLGWSMYKNLLGHQQKYIPGVYVVEGEFDALSVMARQVKAGGPNFVIVSVGGTAEGENIDTLHDFGFSEVYLIGDSPQKSGDKLVESWLPNVKKLRAKIFVGYPHFHGADDPDEIVVKHGLAAMQKVFLNLRDKTCFQQPQEWVFERAQPELEAIDESDVRYRIEVASTWGRLLKSAVECDSFVEYCHKAFGISQALLKREIVAKEEDEYAFILRIVSVLQTVFSVIAQKSIDKDRKLYLWHKEERRMVSVGLADDSSTERELGPTLGPIYQFFAERVGLPTFLEPKSNEEAAGQYLQKKDSQYKWYLRQALIHLAYGAPDYDAATHMGQGINVKRDTAGGAPTIYLVNGKDVYMGTFDATLEPSWKLLDGPSHSSIIFDVGVGSAMEKRWLSGLTEVGYLKQANQVSVKRCWDELHRALDIGWRFKNHSISVEFLTAHLLATTICNTFRRQVMVGFHADTSSGKSKLVMGLISGKDFSRIHLIEGAMGMAKFTAAGIRQTMNNKVRPLCLDEFEDEGGPDKKSRVINEVLEDFRNLVGESNDQTMGSRGGVAQVYNLNFFLFMAAINRPRKVQDANRIITVYMERVEGRDDPLNILTNTFGLDRLKELKNELSVALIPHIAKIQKAYDDIELEYGRPGSKPVTVETRFFEALYPTLAIMKFLGRDYQAFAKAFCEANTESIVQGSTHTDSQSLFENILYSPRLKMRTGEQRDRNDASVHQLLATPETRQEINFSGAGVYYDEHGQILIVNWIQAPQGVLAGHPRWSRETNVYNLRELANRATNAVKPTDLEKSGALQRLRPTGLSTVPLTLLTGYYIGHIIRGMSAGPAPIEAETTESEKTKTKEQVINVDDGEFSA